MGRPLPHTDPDRPHVLCVTGSIVTGCFVAKLVAETAAMIEERGVAATALELGDLDLPVFHERREEPGMPGGAVRLKALLDGSDALLVGAPELNGGVTSVLKNALDWASRPGPGESGRNLSFAGLHAAFVTASKHAHAGLRGGEHLRGMLAALGVTVLPEQVSVPRAPERFDHGRLVDDVVRADLAVLADAVADAARRGRGTHHHLRWAEDAAHVTGRR